MRCGTRSGMPPGAIRWPRPARWTPRRCPAPPRSARPPAAGTRAKVNGRKRHLVVDTLGLLVVVAVTAASVQDRDGGVRAQATA
jgi:hypothetical protein